MSRSLYRVRLGVIVGARGLRGELRVQSFTADPADIGAYGPLSDDTGARVFRLKVRSVVKGVVIAVVDGVRDRDAAEALKGTSLHVERKALPAPADADEFYHADLIGLTVELAGGGSLGTVKAVHDFGAGTVLEVTGGQGPTAMLPFTKAVVPVVDLAGGRMVVDPPPGLLETAEPEGDVG
ncbi:MAG: ribosome maturation factor RimM [Magnetospirillum sp. WYHS-4]